MDLPDWVPQGLGGVKIETIGPRLKLTGRHSDPTKALLDFTWSAELIPPGFVLSRASIEAEHARGKRLCWEVVWLREEVAQRRYDEKQAKRMSRYIHEEEPA